MGLVQQAIRIDCDSQSAIFLAKNPAYNSNTKHIDLQYHFVAGKGGHFGECCRCIDEVYEHSEVLLV